MALKMLGSLALMLQLVASALHLVSLATPAWIQVSVDLPPFDPKAESGHNESSSNHNDTYAVSLVATENVYRGGYLRIRLGVLEWCQQFRLLSSTCHESDFLTVVRVLACCVLVTLGLALVAMLYTACLDVGRRRYRHICLASCFFSGLSALMTLTVVATYSIYSQREVSRMMTERELPSQLLFLGWAFGAIVVSGILESLAAALILSDLRRNGSGFKVVLADDKDQTAPEG